MSSDKQLAQKLAALTGEALFQDGAMVLSAATGIPARVAILQAIDNTVLPRDLTFLVDGASVTLSVAGRRLRSVVATKGPLKAKDALVGKLLTKDDSDDIAELGALLDRLVSGTGNLLMTSDGASGKGGQPDTGVGLATLSEIWQIDPYAEPLPRLEQFLHDIKDAYLASAWVKGGVLADPKGDAEVVAELAALHSDHLLSLVTEHDGIRKQAPEARCVTLHGLLPGDALVSFLNDDNTGLIVATVSDSWVRIFDLWSKG